jgi:hypothetical protein
LEKLDMASFHAEMVIEKQLIDLHVARIRPVYFRGINWIPSQKNNPASVTISVIINRTWLDGNRNRPSKREVSDRLTCTVNDPLLSDVRKADTIFRQACLSEPIHPVPHHAFSFDDIAHFDGMRVDARAKEQPGKVRHLALQSNHFRHCESD